jgi:hypothetical protein
VEHPGEPHGSPVSTPNGTMSSISKSIPSPTRTACRRPSSSISITARSAPSSLADERGQTGHRAAELAAEDPHELVELRVARLLADEHPDRQLPCVMTFGVSAMIATLQAGDVRAVDRSLADVEHESHPAEVVGCSVIERQVARAHQLTEHVST